MPFTSTWVLLARNESKLRNHPLLVSLPSQRWNPQQVKSSMETGEVILISNIFLKNHRDLWKMLNFLWPKRMLPKSQVRLKCGKNYYIKNTSMFYNNGNIEHIL